MRGALPRIMLFLSDYKDKHWPKFNICLKCNSCSSSGSCVQIISQLELWLSLFTFWRKNHISPHFHHKRCSVRYSAASLDGATVPLVTAATTLFTVDIIDSPVTLSEVSVLFTTANAGSRNSFGLNISVLLAFLGEYSAMISSMLVQEPNTRAKTPKTKRMKFLKSTQLQGPKPTSQYVTISIMMGMMRPRREKQNAPMSPMKGPMVGTATARRTEKKGQYYLSIVLNCLWMFFVFTVIKKWFGFFKLIFLQVLRINSNHEFLISFQKHCNNSQNILH